MVQILYSIAAIFLLGITVLNINVKIHGSQERMMFNELALEMTSVGAEMLNEVGKYSYDPSALAAGYGSTIFDRDALRAASTFGQPFDASSPVCDPNPATKFSGCYVINDFDGKSTTRSITRSKNGTPYTVDYNITDIEIKYVEETPPHRPCTDLAATCPASGKTFAKSVTVTISTPVLIDGAGNPVEIEMARVYQYPNYERGKPYSTF